MTGFTNPLALGLAPDGALLVGDWASGKIYRLAVPDGFDGGALLLR